VRVTYPGGDYITRTYDPLHRLDQVKSSGGTVIADFTYDSLGRRIQLDLQNGTRATYAYDALQRLTSLVNKVVSPEALISSFSYTYDKVGNRLTMTTTDGTHTYSYDAGYQLTNVDYPAVFPFPDTSYTYDAVGNRLTVVNGGTTAFTPNELNQYTDVGGDAYTYDTNGNRSSDGSNTYTYDCESRLAGAATPGHPSISYVYDAFGRRIEKNVDGVITKYLYEGNRVIAETDTDGTILTAYVYGAGIDEPLVMEAGGTKCYYHQDGLGSVTDLTDASAAVVESYRYDVYGQADTGSSLGNPYAFTGRRYDPETGLYYYRARYYESTIGAFNQIDPLFRLSASLGSLYTYCHNNPVIFTDPLGLKIRLTGDKNAINQAQQYLSKSETAKKTWDYLDSRPETYTIRTNNTHDDSYQPGSNTVNWDPTSALRTPGGGTQTPALGLAHEMEHARNDSEGDIDYNPDAQYGLVEEKNVISGPETTMANDLGEDTRTSHGGTTFRVGGPTERGGKAAK
jgi:RHS repeat-associated protein